MLNYCVVLGCSNLSDKRVDLRISLFAIDIKGLATYLNSQNREKNLPLKQQFLHL